MKPELIFERESLNPHKVIETINSNGVALIRNVIPASLISNYKAVLEAFFSTLEQQNDADGIQYKKINGLAGPHLSELLFDILLATSNSCIMDCINVYFKNRAVVVPWNHFLFRKRDKQIEQAFVNMGLKHGFHQDKAVIPSAFPFNVWLPLVKVDTNCPGLSFAFPPTKEIFSLPFDLDGYIERNNGHIWSPVLEPGDCLLFHGPTVHGTFFFPNRQNTRYSAEFRCGAYIDTPDEYKNDIVPLGNPAVLT